MNATQRIALAQGAYFAATGVWPLVHMRSFEAVTGPKVDKWLVRTVGVLLGIVGGVLVSAAARKRITGEVAALGAATAAGLGAIDAIYASKRRIAPIYLADAALEAAIVASWAVATPMASRRASRGRLGPRARLHDGSDRPL
jgi:hypothetical protein